MIFLAPLLVIVPVVPSLLLVWLFWPKENSFQPPFLFKLILAAGVGIGFSSISFFLFLLVFGSLSSGYLFWELALIGISTILFGWKLARRQQATDNPFRFPAEPRTPILHVLWTSFGFVLLLSIINFALWTINHPHGGGDALSNWNLRAAFLFRGGEHWRNLFSPLLWSSDYPMLIPCTVARLWHFLEQETLFGPALVAFFFTYGGVGLLVSALFFMRGEQCGLLGGLFLLGTMFLIRHGAYQQADVPLGFFLFVTFVLLHFAGQRGGQDPRGLFVLAGLSAGFVTWTKNEGLLLLVSLLVARAVIGIRTYGWKGYTKELAYFSAGLLPIFLFVGYYRTRLAHPYPMFVAQDLESLVQRIADPLRYWIIGQSITRDVLFFSSGASLLLLVFLLTGGTRIEASDKSDLKAFGLFVLLTWVGYFVFYLVLPVDADSGLRWWLGRSVDRLLLQLWPTIVYIFFLMVNLPRRSPVAQPLPVD